LPKYFGYFTLGEFKEIALKRKLKEPTKTSTTDHAEEEDYGREAKDHDQVFQCPKEGRTRSFQRHSSLEKHLAFGTCAKTIERETLLDEAKVKYAARLEEGSSSVPTIPLPPETCPRSSGCVTPPEGFALKHVKKAYWFNEKQREYLTVRFTIRQGSGKRYNICSMVENNTLKNLKLTILKLLCESFKLALPPGVKKKTYIALLQDLVRCCSCSAV
ncbi:unnamed protein product, partial [Pocillopora meandrina]